VLSIGEFSKVTSLTIKTVRLYHEKGLLPPALVDPASGYRYYDSRSVERARVVLELRRLDFPLADCKAILDCCQEEEDLLAFLERQKSVIDGKLRKYAEIRGSLDTIAEVIRSGRERAMTVTERTGVQEKTLGSMLVAGIRDKGRYDESGKRFARIGRAAGRHIGGPAMNLHFDTEFKEEDADFESCFPIRARVAAEGITVRELPGGRFVTLVHRGPYGELGQSYAKIFASIRARGLTPLLPSREVYLKGPGMIFKGNPKKYVTEIQVPIE
jgi:DNA-binding transcriptional MerR regulator/effector-binding domain-containing protein